MFYSFMVYGRPSYTEEEENTKEPLDKFNCITKSVSVRFCQLSDKSPGSSHTCPMVQSSEPRSE